jgi:predicted nucleic acid-binding protein
MTAENRSTTIATGIQVFYDSKAVADELRQLTIAHLVTGKKKHDARLVALRIVNGIQELATFNAADFKRFTQIQLVTSSSTIVPPAP